MKRRIVTLVLGVRRGGPHLRGEAEPGHNVRQRNVHDEDGFNTLDMDSSLARTTRSVIAVEERGLAPRSFLWASRQDEEHGSHDPEPTLDGGRSALPSNHGPVISVTARFR
jgi:hypothetical protein